MMKTDGEITSKRKRKSTNYEEKIFVAKCSKSGCGNSQLTCFANVASKCYCVSHITSRWYHITHTEHFCNDCFEYYYRSSREGYPAFLDWRKKWIESSLIEGSVKIFMNCEVLPFWVQCSIPSCRKWRSVSNVQLKGSKFNRDYIVKFKCPSLSGPSKKASCEDPQDLDVGKAYDEDCLPLMIMPPLLEDSPAAPFLTKYFPDNIGLNPISSKAITDNIIDCLDSKFQPFLQPNDSKRSNSVQPDCMAAEECRIFPEYQFSQVMYLTIRNLVIGLWNRQCCKWLTIEHVGSYIICRGLSRIRCLCEAERILQYLTIKGLVNFGIVKAPSPSHHLISSQKTVTVIGAGAAGLGAARQLTNFGFKVTVIESQDRIGGRICDDFSLGKCIGLGAQMLTGTTNNPFSYLCSQAGTEIMTIDNSCDLYTDEGQLVSASIESKMEMHFYAMLEFLCSWRQNQANDTDLLCKLEEIHAELVNLNRMNLCEEDHQVLQFHISNLEYACGAPLSQVSAKHWDQNEDFAQFAGGQAILPSGYACLLNKIADGIDVRLGAQVESINTEESDEVSICCRDGQTFHADKVVITVPLTVLQNNTIKFTPELPEQKIKAINNLGTGIVEKVILKFKSCFWKEKIQNAGFFGHVPSCESDRGVFSIFYDLTCTKAHNNQSKDTSDYYLMTYLTGNAVELLDKKSDEEIVELCMKKLREMFEDCDNGHAQNGHLHSAVPEPCQWLVTRWKSNPHVGMSYSFVKDGGSGDDYDQLAAAVDDRLFFAGEATNRQHPQTVTGAYLSGLREAEKIVNLFHAI